MAWVKFLLICWASAKPVSLHRALPFTVQRATDSFGWWKEASGNYIEKYLCSENVVKKQKVKTEPLENCDILCNKNMAVTFQVCVGWYSMNT